MASEKLYHYHPSKLVIIVWDILTRLMMYSTASILANWAPCHELHLSHNYFQLSLLDFEAISDPSQLTKNSSHRDIAVLPLIVLGSF